MRIVLIILSLVSLPVLASESPLYLTICSKDVSKVNQAVEYVTHKLGFHMVANPLTASTVTCRTVSK